MLTYCFIIQGELFAPFTSAPSSPLTSMWNVREIKEWGEWREEEGRERGRGDKLGIMESEREINLLEG